MSFRNIGIVYRKELREALRDAVPLSPAWSFRYFLFPLLSVVSVPSSAVSSKKRKKPPRKYGRGGRRFSQGARRAKSNSEIEVVPAAPNWKDLVVEKEIPVAVEIPTGSTRA